jgi:dynamin-like GTPase MGM1, mitochondrial
MSARQLTSAAFALRTRQAALTTRRNLHHVSRNGLLFSSNGARTLRQRGWPLGAYSIHNVPAIRTISFARVLPRLATKLLNISALAGGATVAGLTYLQYQAHRMYTDNPQVQP